jgi:hypothetical protein
MVQVARHAGGYSTVRALDAGHQTIAIEEGMLNIEQPDIPTLPI